MLKIISLLLVVLMVRIGFTQVPQATTQTQIEKQGPQSIPGKEKPAEQIKKKKFPWFRVLVMTALVVGAGVLILSACKNPNGPEPPIIKPPFEEKRYTIKVEYIRINVTRSDLMGRGVPVMVANRNTGLNLVSQQMERKDDYHYEKQFSEVLETESYGNLYYIYGIDEARWDGTNNDTCIVGDRFVLTVIETGFTLELINLAQNNLEQNPYRGQNAKMAIWCLKRDGTITNGD